MQAASLFLLASVPFVAAQHAQRSTLLYFSGALCWKTDNIARSERQLQQKCDRSYREPGFLSRYSFGLRYDVWRLHHSAPGFKILATDYPPSLPKGPHLTPQAPPAIRHAHNSTGLPHCSSMRRRER